jgi:hypothetical protein
MTDEIKDDLQFKSPEGEALKERNFERINDPRQEEAPKPPTIPLFDIPDHVLRSMSAEAEKDMDKFSNPVDFIMAERKRRQVEVSGPTGLPAPTSAPCPQSEQPKVPLIAIDGHVLPGDTVTMMLYALVTLAKKDKKIAKLLKSFKFKMGDANGEQIWP